MVYYNVNLSRIKSIFSFQVFIFSIDLFIFFSSNFQIKIFNLGEINSIYGSGNNYFRVVNINIIIIIIVYIDYCYLSNLKIMIE